MDSRPIARSSKMLLTTGSKVENTGMKWNASRSRSSDFGGPPSLIEPVKGSIILRNLRAAKSVTAIPLDGAGRPIGAGIEAVKSGDSWSIAVGEPVTSWYVVVVG